VPAALGLVRTDGLKGSQANKEEKEKKSVYWARPEKMILGQKERWWNWDAEFDFFEFGFESKRFKYFQTEFELDSK
jgi:hypothetical protein